MNALWVFVAAAFAASADRPNPVIALPVAVGHPGNGPYTIQVWPDDGCKECNLDAKDVEALNVELGDVRAARGASSSYPNVSYFYAANAGGGPVSSSIEKVRKTLLGCTTGSSGKLAPNTSSALNAFGVRFDCAATHKVRWMSVIMGDNHKPRTVYFMADGPIVVARTR